MQAEIEEPGAISQLPSQSGVLPGRGRIPGRMIVDEDERGGSDPERRAQDFPGMHEGGGLGASRDERVDEVVILGVQENDPEVFPVVIGSSEEVSSEKGDGFR